MKTYFELKNFSFSFDSQGPLFFDNITLRIEKSGLTCIVGKNGVGKTTFFRLLQGILHPGEIVSGILHVNEHVYDLSCEQDRYALHQQSMILYQNFDRMLAPNFTGWQNLSFAQFPIFPTLSLVSALTCTTNLIQRFAIPLDQQVKLLSGGQRQMLAILMVTQKPIDLLLLDEPTAALDHDNSNYVMQGLVSLVEEKDISVLCVLHDHEMVDRYVKHLIQISQDEQGKRILTVM